MEESLTRIFNAATSFHHASILCSSIWTDPDGVQQHTHIPMIVNRSFACELYLKACLMDHGIETRGHEIKILFNKLPELTKNNIKEIYLGDNPNLVHPLEETLHNINKSFETFRYLHEKNTSLMLKMGGLNHLSRALYIYIVSRRPELRPKQWEDKLLQSL